MTTETELLARLRPLLRHSATGMLSGDEARHGEDLAQEAWIAVWKALPDYKGTPDGVVNWCMAVARNRMRNWIRDELLAPRRGSHHQVPASDCLDELLGATERAEQVQHAYHDGRVAAVIDALPPGYRAYVIERFWHGVSTTELQTAMGRSIWTRVKRRLEIELADLVT